MSTINIYEYPTNPSNLDEYRIAVMRASKDGLTTEIQERCVSDGRWERDECPHWNWVFYRYRIAAPKIAKGHNPDGLSESQVEAKYGWRLLDKDEIDAERCLTPDIQIWRGEWDDSQWSGGVPERTYRTKKPEGYFLPKPEVPLSLLDAQALNRFIGNADNRVLRMALPVIDMSELLTDTWNAALKYERSRAK